MRTRAAKLLNKGIWLTHLARSIDLRSIMPAGQSLPNHYIYYYHDNQPDRSFERLDVANLKFWPGEKFSVATFEGELLLMLAGRSHQGGCRSMYECRRLGQERNLNTRIRLQ
jgi:hypothetical protein